MSELPEKFSANNIHLHLPNGAVAGDGTRITVDGSLSVVPSDAERTEIVLLECGVGSRRLSAWSWMLEHLEHQDPPEAAPGAADRRARAISCWG